MPSPLFIVSSFNKNNLYRALSNGRIDAAELFSHPRASYLRGYLQHLKARTIVVETSYVDGDYLDDYVAFYARCFTNYDRVCKRVHFFAKSFRKREFINLVRGHIEPEKEDEIKQGYLGFVVARPLSQAVVGRTILRTYDSDGNRRYYKSIRQYTANLFGIDLSLKSLAFQEQDKTVSACATVSLWCCFHKTSELFGTPAPRPAIITRVANQVATDARPMPSPGLSIEQICHAITYVGLEPEVFMVEEKTPFISIVYSYLMMELPVILIAEAMDQETSLGLHAITLAGFSLQEDTKNHRESIPTKSQHINEFYGHDDQVGPFARLCIESPENLDINPEVLRKNSSIVLKKSDGKKYIPRNVIVPVYNKIRLSFTNIGFWIARLDRFFKRFVESDDYEWDIFLVQVNDYKRSLKLENFEIEHEELLLGRHPKFIWKSVFEINNLKILEILADATEMPGSFPFYKIIWHDKIFREKISIVFELIHKNDEDKVAYVRHILTKALFDFLKENLRE